MMNQIILLGEAYWSIIILLFLSDAHLLQYRKNTCYCDGRLKVRSNNLDSWHDAQ
ncbi:hypothetical protein LIPSTDRAFT_178531 [Lipomyces starkeyi NRRL Y-11557]|uniref:Uncharacterized protein n=1 Tax=Lipomyces starkeyi NRRL Y-11557 TaxID=675824 RepID=A0A1E3PXW5_LIPST|nr:hypothetical protein LIPSTDRAFT_178531 [Lipomyces starkeyi NRRL Y-11557]